MQEQLDFNKPVLISIVESTTPTTSVEKDLIIVTNSDFPKVFFGKLTPEIVNDFQSVMEYESVEYFSTVLTISQLRFILGCIAESDFRLDVDTFTLREQLASIDSTHQAVIHFAKKDKNHVQEIQKEHIPVIQSTLF